jgi:hypothetical protein
MNKTNEAIKKYVKEAIKKESQTINELKKILKEPMNNENRKHFENLLNRAENRFEQYQAKLA